MKLVFASDIHGSAYYCAKLLEQYQNEQADKLILLGDILYHGPRNALPKEYAPMEVAQMLNAHKQEILCVRGNCDAEVDQMVLEFPIMADYAVLSLGDRMAYITHGHIHNSGNLPMMRPQDLLIHGHTHRPAVHELIANQQPAFRVVLGAWHTEGSMVKVTADDVELIHFPF